MAGSKINDFVKGFFWLSSGIEQEGIILSAGDRVIVEPGIFIGDVLKGDPAGPVFSLLGAKDLGVSADYKTEKMPAVNVGDLDGQLAWRQHDDGHTDAPNIKFFIQWADKFIGHSPN